MCTAALFASLCAAAPCVIAPQPARAQPNQPGDTPELKRARGDVAGAQAAVDAVQRDLDKLAADRTRLAGQVRDEQAAVAKANDALNDATGDRARAQADADARERDVRFDSTNLDAARDRAKAADKDVDDAKKQVFAATTALDKARDAARDAVSARGEVADLRRAAEAAAADADAEQARVRAALAKDDAAYRDLLASLKTADGDLLALRSQEPADPVGIDAAARRRLEIAQQVAAAERAAFGRDDACGAALQRQADAARRWQETLLKLAPLVEAEPAVAGAKDRVDDARKMLESATKRADDARKSVRLAESDLNRDKAELSQARTRLQFAETTLDRTKAEVDKRERTIANLQSQLDRLNAQEQTLRDTLRRATDRLRQAQANLQRLLGQRPR
jgi:chromosome segregation ATPase